MVEGEAPGFFDNPVFDDDYEDDQEVNRTGLPEIDSTWAFEPGAASTPHNGDDQYEMQTMMHEQSGLPESTPLIGAQYQQERSWDALTSKHPEASSIDLETFYSKTGRLQVKMYGAGKKILSPVHKRKIYRKRTT